MFKQLYLLWAILVLCSIQLAARERPSRFGTNAQVIGKSQFYERGRRIANLIYKGTTVQIQQLVLINQEGKTIAQIRSNAKPLASNYFMVTDKDQEGTYYYDSTEHAMLDNTGLCLVDAAGRRFKRIYSGSINVKWFGAKGNGIANDYAALQLAISTVQGTSGVLFVPKGRYLITASLTATASIHVTGEASQNGNFNDVSGTYGPLTLTAPTIIKTVSTGGDWVFRIESDSNIEGLAFAAGDGKNGKILYNATEMPSLPNNSKYGLYINGGDNTIVRCSAVQATEYGFYAAKSAVNIFNSVTAFANKNGLNLGCFDSKVIESFFHHNVEDGIHVRGNYASIRGNRIEWNGGYGIVTYGGEFLISNNLFDRQGKAGVYLNSQWGGVVSDNYFSRNGASGNGKKGRFGFSVPGSTSYKEITNFESCHIKIQYQRDVAITGNRFRAGSDDAGTGAMSPGYIYYNAGANDPSIQILGNAGEQAYAGGFGGYNPNYPGGSGRFANGVLASSYEPYFSKVHASTSVITPLVNSPEIVGGWNVASPLVIPHGGDDNFGEVTIRYISGNYGGKSGNVKDGVCKVTYYYSRGIGKYTVTDIIGTAAPDIKVTVNANSVTISGYDHFRAYKRSDY
jgi:parallel beta-helix repeat protein